MTPLDQEAREAAQEAAIKMQRERGNPHWHDMRDMYVLGATFGRSQMLRAVLKEIHREPTHGTFYEKKELIDRLKIRFGEKK